MRRASWSLGALLGGLTTLPLMALSYLGERWAGGPFVPFDLFDWLARVLPGRLITTTIDTMVHVITALRLGPIADVAKQIEQLEGIVLIIVGGILCGLLVTWVLRRSRWPGGAVGAVVGGIIFLFVAYVEISFRTAIAANPLLALLWLAVLIVGWGTSLGAMLAGQSVLAVAPAVLSGSRSPRRRALLQAAGGSIGIALVAWALGHLTGRQQVTEAGQPVSSVPTAVPASTATPPRETATPTPPAGTATPVSGAPIEPAPGTRPEVTPTKDFYLVPPVIAQASWVMKVSGLFDRPRPLSLPDLLAYPAVTQPITISCISNLVGGDLIGTAQWMGVRLGVVLQDLGLRPEAQALNISAADGFYESVILADMMDPRTLLVYGMNGAMLPPEHGYPLRIYIPNRYGMKQPKWITAIEAVDRRGPGFWVDRGWSLEAYPQTLSIIDTVAKDSIANGRVPVGGIAWAGNRGIQKVEVQVDRGDWQEAVLLEPSLGPLTWVLWRYNWPVVSGRHTFRVRATDGTGALQIEKAQDPYPDGATGYDSLTATF